MGGVLGLGRKVDVEGKWRGRRILGLERLALWPLAALEMSSAVFCILAGFEFEFVFAWMVGFNSVDSFEYRLSFKIMKGDAAYSNIYSPVLPPHLHHQHATMKS